MELRKVIVGILSEGHREAMRVAEDVWERTGGAYTCGPVFTELARMREEGLVEEVRSAPAGGYQFVFQQLTASK